MALFGRETAADQRRAEAWRAWFLRQHPFALASLALGVFSLTHFGTLFVDEIAGVVLGVLAIRADRRGATDKSIWLAYAGVVVGVISLLLAIAIYAWPHIR
jgi:hypothetical protein